MLVLSAPFYPRYWHLVPKVRNYLWMDVIGQGRYSVFIQMYSSGQPKTTYFVAMGIPI